MSGRTISVRVRRATVDDLAAIRQIVEAAYAPYATRLSGRRPGPMDDDYALRVASRQVYVAATEDRDEAIGILVLVDLDDALLLDNIAVAPASVRKGAGRTLLRFTEAEARRRGYRRMRLYTNALMYENCALYTRAGWHETHRAHEAGHDRIYFEKPVPED